MQVKGIDVVFGQNWIQQFQDNRYSDMTESAMKRCSVSTIIGRTNWCGATYHAMEQRHRAFYFCSERIRLTR